MKLFITGIGGCVGHYLFDALITNPDYRLYLLVRDPKKLKFNPNAYPNVQIITDDLTNIEKHAEMVKQMDFVIHMAADWGGNEGNYDYSLALFSLLDPYQCKKVIYLSTASILDRDNQPVEAAEKFGTHYIRSKYRFYKKLPELKIFPNVITLFPTWVLGGDEKHPYSHASSGILAMRKWLWLIRFFTVDASFHFIHAKDIASIVKFILENEVKEKNFVLGNKALTADELIRETCEFYGQKICCQIPVSLPLIQFLALITGRKLHPWDIYCLNRKHFVHRAVNAGDFGIASSLQSIPQVLKELK